MSEKLLKILLSELNTIRIICQKKECGAIIEGDLATLDRILRAAQCPCCGTSLRHGKEYPLSQLICALNSLAGMNDVIGIQFVIPMSAEGVDA